MCLKRFVGLFCLGAAAYPLLEVAWRGHSHWSMAIAGGLGASALAHVARRQRRRPLRQRCLIGAAWITLIEFIAGCVCNKWLKLAVWDYSHLPLNLLGQICLPFTLLWFLLCIPVLALFERKRVYL